MCIFCATNKAYNEKKIKDKLLPPGAKQKIKRKGKHRLIRNIKNWTKRTGKWMTVNLHKFMKASAIKKLYYYGPFDIKSWKK